MKPYIFNYSEELELIKENSFNTLNESTVRTFSIESDDNLLQCIDSTRITETIENIDNDCYFSETTIMTNIIESNDQYISLTGTSETRTLEATDHEGVSIYFDTTTITKTFENIDAD